MPSLRQFRVVALVAWVCLWHVVPTATVVGQVASSSAEVQSMSPSVGPQQMVPYGTTDSYSTTYPSTSPSAYTPIPSSYPSTGAPMIAPYASSTPRMAAVDYGLSPIEPTPGVMPARPAETSLAPLSIEDPSNSAYLRALESNDEIWTWQILPTGLMYKSYLAGNREPRLGCQWVHLRDEGWMWDATLGGRVGLLRYGSENRLWPQGYQLDVEGAAFVRMNLEEDRDVDNVDFRAGLIQTMRQGPFEGKFGYYHLSSHIGDEYLVRHPDYQRINYVRESLILGIAYYLNPSLRLYWETGWCFHTDGFADPWEFQFGIDFTSPEPTGPRGAPFFAINSHLRQENDFSGNMTVQTGWQWRGQDGHLLRIGMQYFNGLSDQYQFYTRFEEQIGLGLWYDF